MQFELDAYVIGDRTLEQMFETLIHIRDNNLIPGCHFTKYKNEVGRYKCSSDVPTMLSLFVKKPICTVETIGENENVLWHITRSEEGSPNLEVVTSYMKHKKDVVVKVNVKSTMGLPYLVQWGFKKYFADKAYALRVLEEEHSLHSSS